MPAPSATQPQPPERPPEPQTPIERHLFATPVVHEVPLPPSPALLDRSTW
jgi:hypothetical protein